MRPSTRTLFLTMIVLAAVLTTWQWSGRAQPGPKADPGRLEFVVVESYDAMYLGDTAGHRGRSGNLRTPPNLALGDPVFRGTVRVGRISHLNWDRTKESLDIEFDPESLEIRENGRAVGPLRIAIGDTIWAPLGGENPAK